MSLAKKFHKNLSKRIRSYRLNNNLTLKMLSRELGISVSQLSDVEHNRKKLTTFQYHRFLELEAERG